ncbi:MAG: hypothetical protein Q9167_000599 [Letrouitia subvulpina]
MISLQAICHFGLASKIPTEGGHATFKDISLGTALNESTGFNIAHGTTQNSFEEISSLPHRKQRYAEAMRWFSTDPGFEANHILDGFDWAGLGWATIVDIGGSYGSVSIAIAQKFSNLSCIVQDQKDIAEVGCEMLPASLEKRVSFMGHNFFDPQPVKAAAVYLLRWILHDWSDAYAVRILQALRPALTDGSRIVICDLVLPQPGSASILHDRNARSFDLAMLEFHNGKERSLDDWNELFNMVDPKLEIVGVCQPSGSRLSIIELLWHGAIAEL